MWGEEIEKKPIKIKQEKKAWFSGWLFLDNGLTDHK